MMRRAARTSTWRPFPLAIGVIFAGPACSLVDGWSDLQGGKRASDTRDGGGVKDGSTSMDANAGADSSVVTGIQNVTCNGVLCPAGMGCCVGLTGSLQCTAQAACTGQGSEFLGCSGPASCSATAPVCCFSYDKETSSCLAGCGAGDEELCVAGDNKTCTGGKACTDTLAGLSNIPACQ